LRSLILGSALILLACDPRGRNEPAPPAKAPVLPPPAGSAAPVVRKSTVVAFWLSTSDTLDGDSASGFLDDFRSYTASAARELRDADIDLIATSADSIIVELKGGPRRVIQLAGLDFPFGYVLVEPGYPETILTGPMTDDDLMDEVYWYFGYDDTPDSLDNQTLAASELRGRPACVAPRSGSRGVAEHLADPLGGDRVRNQVAAYRMRWHLH